MKIDVTKIAGYETMTADERIKALEEFEFDDNSAEIKKLTDENKNFKTLISNANSEAAEWKKKYRDTLSESERLKAEQEEQYQTLLNENKELKTKSKVEEYAKQYIARGYDVELANETAKALVDGDMDKVFANENTFTEALKKDILANGVGKQKLSDGQPPKPDDAETALVKSIVEAAGVKGE